MSDSPNYGAPFAAMAEKVQQNANNGFAGAFVIVPHEGDPIEVLILDERPNPAVLWAQVKARIDYVLAELEDMQRRRAGGWS